ncbi:MAG: hypothetical protein IT215_02430 [Chitinophagaceae bacterium]|nr:hypothetical protein [Chitinophagaceae bacterium]
MSEDEKSKLINFLLDRLNRYEGHADLAWETIFQQNDNNYSTDQKLAGLKYIHTSYDTSLKRKQDAYGVISEMERFNGKEYYNLIDVNILDKSENSSPVNTTTTETKSSFSDSVWGFVKAVIGWAIFIYLINTFVCN